MCILVFIIQQSRTRLVTRYNQTVIPRSHTRIRAKHSISSPLPGPATYVCTEVLSCTVPTRRRRRRRLACIYVHAHACAHPDKNEDAHHRSHAHRRSALPGQASPPRSDSPPPNGRGAASESCTACKPFHTKTNKGNARSGPTNNPGCDIGHRCLVPETVEMGQDDPSNSRGIFIFQHEVPQDSCRSTPQLGSRQLPAGGRCQAIGFGRSPAFAVAHLDPQAG